MSFKAPFSTYRAMQYHNKTPQSESLGSEKKADADRRGKVDHGPYFKISTCWRHYIFCNVVGCLQYM
jgi:hypothetical protein